MRRRTTLRVGIVIMIMTVAVVVVGGLAFVGFGVLLNAPRDAGLNWIGLFPLVVSMVVGRLMARTNLWVEVDGDAIRERRLFTGLVVERPVEWIRRVTPLVSGVGGLTGALIDAVLKTPNRGYLISFREGRRISLPRGDTRGLDDFMGALRDRLGPGWSNRPD